MVFYPALVFLFSVMSVFGDTSLPMLNIDGFAWAENIAFDGLGNAFVSESIRGELWRIYLCNDGTEYCSEIYMDDGFKQFGGLQISPDGSRLFAGAVFDDDNKTFAILSIPTNNGGGAYQIIVKTENLANGLAVDWEKEVLYYTDEGTGSDIGGSVTSFDIKSNEQRIIKDFVQGADGAWLDASTDRLYIGELLSKKIMVFDTSKEEATFIGEYPGLNIALGKVHMLDDITVYSSADTLESTMLLGADWTGKVIQKFSLDGLNVTTVPLPDDLELYEPTSVRWGKGPGFDPNSIYITEGGGVTKRQTNRRVLQIKLA